MVHREGFVEGRIFHREHPESQMLSPAAKLVDAPDRESERAVIEITTPEEEEIGVRGILEPLDLILYCDDFSTCWNIFRNGKRERGRRRRHENNKSGIIIVTTHP